jgi:hypothetical protein
MSGGDKSGGDPTGDPYCRLCGDRLTQGAVATTRRACCLNATPIAGVCPTHGPVGSHHAVDAPDESERG